MRIYNLLAWAALIFLPPAARGGEAAPDPRGAEFFEKKIRPVLVEHCYTCHSAGANKTKGGLAVDTRAGLREGGDGGPAVVPGKSDQGTLLKAIRHDGAVKMPSAQKRLPDAVVADFEAWVRMGAPDPRDGASAAKKGIDLAGARGHWAYKPVAAAAPPAVRSAPWPAADLDRFVLARLEAKGLAPAPDAPQHAWLRRVTFDLTGLPPSPEEVAAYLSDAAPDAAVRVVDRLLASPRFGEHWARHWLDGVRFDARTPTADRYRDWVVRAFNADVPYDRFLTLQLAGDLLPAAGDPKEQADRVFATQMLALNAGEMDPVEGMIEVLGQHVLGVSINCAKCHDHKLDAFSQHDYYALAGVFTSSAVAGHKSSKGPSGGVEVPGEPGVKVLALIEGRAADAPLLVRGEKSQMGPVVPRRFPAVLAGDAQTPLGRVTRQSGRLELARWVVDPKHPLTARVMANRVWLWLFGAGLVTTPNDFGLSGDPPANPALLDHLAARFSVDFKWSVKRLVREVVLSRTYRQGSVNAPARAADPDNTLFARARLRRLTYEQTVDALYATAGVLSFDAPPKGRKGVPVSPRFAPAGKDLPGVGYRALYHDDPYTRVLFDGADPDLLTEKREESVTAPQMLFLLNSPQVVALAQKVAARAAAGARDAPASVAAAYRILFARPPTDAERAAALAYLKTNPFDRLCHALLASSEFGYLE